MILSRLRCADTIAAEEKDDNPWETAQNGEAA
jgi:hypothetical protein